MKAAARLLLVLALAAPAFALAQAPQSQAPAPTCRLFASATIVGYNTRVRLDWSSRNATGGYLPAVGAIAPNGSAYVVPGRNTTYAASFMGPGGTVVCRVAIAVQASAPSLGSGAAYSGGVVNIDGTTDIRGSSIDATGSPVNTTGSVNTSGSSVNTTGSVNTGGSIDTNGSVDTSGSINTNGSIDTSGSANLNGTVDLGGKVTLPTIPDFKPTTQSSGGLIGGIVPAECRGDGTVTLPNGTVVNKSVVNCDLCSLAQMVQNATNFGIGLTIPAAVLLFAFAGALFFSSRGNPTQINQAKSIFMRVVIGVVIAVGAFLLVNTVMNMLVHGKDFQGWSWKELRCAETRKARLYNMDLSQYLSTSLPALQSPGGSNSAGGTNSTFDCSQYGSGYTVSGGECYAEGSVTSVGPATSGGSGGRTSCPSGYAYTADEGGYCQSSDPTIPDAWTEACPSGYVYTQEEGGYCIDPNNSNRWVEQDGTGGSGNPGSGTLTIGSGTRGRAMCPDYNPYCSTDALRADGFNEAEARAMSCIAMTENGGRAAGCSGTGPCGVYQISRTNWNDYAPAGCTAADFGGNLTAAQNNGNCNRLVAGELHDEVGYQPWTGLCNTPGGCNVGTVHAVGYGQPWNPAARACVANYDPDNL